VLGEYIQHSRKRLWEKLPVDLDRLVAPKLPPREWVMNLWIAVSLYGQDLPDKMSARLSLTMGKLIRASVDAAKQEDKDARMSLALDCWEELMTYQEADADLPVRPPALGEGQKGQGAPSEGQGEGKSGKPDEKGDEKPEKAKSGDDSEAQPDDEPEDESEGGKADEKADEPEDKKGSIGNGASGPDESAESGESADEGDSGEAGPSDKGGSGKGQIKALDDFDCKEVRAIPKELLAKVLDAITHELEDLSASVQQVLRRPDAHARAKRADYDGPAAARIRQQVEPEISSLRQAFKRQAQEASRTVSGLSSGKLDTRKLARAGIGNMHVYMRREVLSKPNMAVGLLLDVSGSMSPHMDTVWATATIFGEALIGLEGVNFLALTYTGGGDDVDMTEICSRDMGKVCLGNVEQGGGTPSGVAIVTAQVLMARMPEGNKVLIHFTDGSPDGGAGSVIPAVKACRDAGVTVWAIGLEGY
ncbi:MAG: VWA domain-containing protein, partial [Gammaproteobacteria bacterium]|nr:VWA domain-containing protein [Gammaproteobacteria bacterium]